MDETTLLPTLQALARHQPLTVGELSTLLAQERNATAALVTQLVEGGWVRRSRTDAFPRVQLHLTAAGQARRAVSE